MIGSLDASDTLDLVHGDWPDEEEEDGWEEAGVRVGGGGTRGGGERVGGEGGSDGEEEDSVLDWACKWQLAHGVTLDGVFTKSDADQVVGGKTSSAAGWQQQGGHPHAVKRARRAASVSAAVGT